MDIINIIVTLVVYGLIFWLLWWFINWVGLPQPFLKVAQVLIGLFAILVLVSVLLGGSYVPLVRWAR